MKFLPKIWIFASLALLLSASPLAISQNVVETSTTTQAEPVADTDTSTDNAQSATALLTDTDLGSADDEEPDCE